MAKLADGCERRVAVVHCVHEVHAKGDAYECVRCALDTRVDRRLAAAGNRCPVPRLEPPEPEFERAYRHERQKLLDWVQWQRQPAARAAVPGPPPVPPPPVGFLPAYRGHQWVRAPGRGNNLCVQCGCRDRLATVRFGPCAPQRPLPEAALHALRSGRYNQAILAAPPALQAIAREGGWIPNGVGLPPA